MAGAAKKYRQLGHCRFSMPGGGSQGWALIARDEASSSHPRLLFMGLALHGVSAPEQEIHLLARPLAVRRRSGAALYPNVIEPPAQLLAGLEERHPLLVHRVLQSTQARTRFAGLVLRVSYTRHANH